MKNSDVKIGATYQAKVTNKVVDVRIDGTHEAGGWTATNLATGKTVRIKSAQRLRGAAKHTTEPNPKATKAKDDGENRTRHKGKMSGLDAAAKVLANATEPMTCGQIAEAAMAKGYWSPEGKTPAATLYSAILRDIRKGDAARFRKVDRGQFELVG